MGEIICCELEERNAHDPFAVVLKKAGTGTVGHQQAEIEILHCHVVKHKNLLVLTGNWTPSITHKF